MAKEEIIETRLTDKLKKEFTSGMDKINVLYCREDFEAAINAVRRAPADALPSRKRYLSRMCKEYGIDMNKLLANSNLLNTIPSRSDLFDRIYDLVHSMYLQTPSPQTVMERIVRNLAPEYKDDSVRLAILKKMIVGAGFDCKTIDISRIVEWAQEHMSAGPLKEYIHTNNDQVRLHMVVDNLDERIFNVLNFSGPDLHAQLKLMIEKTESFKNDYKVFDAEKMPYKISDIPVSDEVLDSLKKYCALKNIPLKNGEKVLSVLKKILKADHDDLSDFGSCFGSLQKDYENWLKGIYYSSPDPYHTVLELYKENKKGSKGKESSKAPDSSTQNLEAQLNLIIEKTETIKTNYRLFDADQKPYEISDIPLSDEALGSLQKYCAKKRIPFKDGEKVLDVLKRVLKAKETGLDDFSDCFELLQNDYEGWLNSIYYMPAARVQSLFTLYKYARRDERRKEERVWLAVKLADDFAYGIFRTNNGQTREYLYWFAILFGMTAVLKPGDQYDRDKDLVKNLFEDYYCDNLMRYFTDRYEDSDNQTIFEKEPAGEGINYKNYVEVIYLYFINQSETKLTPGQKIDRAQSCIEKCTYFAQKVKEYKDAEKIKKTSDPESAEYADAIKILDGFKSKTMSKYKEAAEKEDEDTPTFLNDTTYYQEEYLPEIFEIDEKELPGYIYRHFLVMPKYVQPGSIPRIMLSSSEHTAYDILTKKVSAVRELNQEYIDEAELQNELEGVDDETEKQKTEEDLDETVTITLKFLHDFADTLIRKYPTETQFITLVEHIRRRIGKNIDLTAGNKTLIMAAILHILYKSSGEYLDNKKIREKLDYITGTVSGININRCIKTLQELGFSVDKQTISQKRPVYTLKSTVYEDDTMNQIMKYVSENHIYEFDKSASLLSDLIFLRNNTSGRPTRNTMLTALAVLYVNDYDYDVLKPLPVIYRNFSTKVDPVLREARYQPLSEKNIFDIFIICAVLVKLIDIFR